MRRLAFACLAAGLAAGWATANAGTSDIVRPLLVLSAAPTTVVSGEPTATRATAPGGIQLSLTQAFPIQGGALVQATFQRGLPRAPGHTVTVWVEVTPTFAPRYRVVLPEKGPGTVQRSASGGRSWASVGPAQVRTTGSNIVFTLLESDGATADATIRVGWTALRPDGGGATASGYPAVLGTLSGTGPWRLPTTGLIAGAASRRPNGVGTAGRPVGTCTVPSVSFAVGLGGLVITAPPPRWPADASVSVSAVPDLAGAVAPPYLAGTPTGGTFSLFPAGLGSAPSGTVKLPAAPAGPLVVPASALSAAPLSLEHGGAVAFTVRLRVDGGICERVSPVVPLVLPPAAAAGSLLPALAQPPTLPPGCDEAGLRSELVRLRRAIERISADVAALSGQRAGLVRSEKAARTHGKSFERMKQFGALAPEQELRIEIIDIDAEIAETKDRLGTFMSALRVAEARLADCR